MFKKLILVTFLYACLTTSANSQSVAHNPSLFLSIGPELPIGSYGSKNSSSSTAGFAKSGASIGIDFTYDVTRKIGLCSFAAYHTNRFDGSSLASGYQQQNPGSSYTATNNYWNRFSFMVGAYDIYHLKNSKHPDQFAFFDRALIGLTSVSSPEIIVSKTTGSSTTTVKQGSANSTAFAYMVGIGIRSVTEKRYTSMFSIDYYNSKPTFNNVPTTNGTSASTITFKQSISTILFSFGFGIKLGKIKA